MGEIGEVYPIGGGPESAEEPTPTPVPEPTSGQPLDGAPAPQEVGAPAEEDLVALKVKLAELEAREAANRLAAEKQRETDFRKRLESLPEEERIKEELNWERSRRLEIEMESVRSGLRNEQPLFIGVMDQLAQYADIEMEPQELRDMASNVGPYIEALIKAEVEARIAQEKQSLEETYRKQYGITPNRVAATSNAPTPSRTEYERFRQQLKEKKGGVTTDDLARLISLRNRAR